MTMRSKIATLMAEFLGTAILATTVINVSRSQIGIGYFVAIGAGLALVALVLFFGKVSGAHFNPAITIGAWTTRKIGTLQALAYIAVQMLGGLAAWQLANYWVGQEITSIAGNEFEWRVLIAEGVGTFVLAFAVAAALFDEAADMTRKAMMIGGGLFLGVVAASLASNAALNPAVALGNQTWSLAYALGPIIGGVVGFNLYVLLYAPGTSLLPVRAKEKYVNVPAPVKATTAARKTTAKKKPAARKRK